MRTSTAARMSLFTLIYTLGVILFGAFVRATGSGAGCGRSWPTCQGELIPAGAEGAQAVEFTHRFTSALVGMLIIVLVYVVFRSHERGHPARKAAMWSLLLVVTEGLFGALLVRGEWVADDASLGRALVVPAHLVNTFLLLAALTMTLWWAQGGARVAPRRDRSLARGLAAAMVGMLALGSTGAISALADTLFPVASIEEGLAADLDSTSHFLTQLRVIHPLAALVVAGLLVFIVQRHGVRQGASPRLARFVMLLVAAQLGAGALNVVLLTPVWLQLVHLLLADLLWIGVVWFAATALSVATPAERTTATRSAVPR